MTEQAVEETQQIEAPGGPIQVSWAGIPRVNLLPLTIVESRRFRQTQAKLGVGVLAALVLAGAGVVWAQAQVSGAKDDLASAQATVTSLQQEQTKYNAVPALVQQVEDATEARATAMSTDVLWYRLLNDLAGAEPSGLTADSVALTITGAATTSGATSTGTAAPLTTTGLGTVTMSGTAPTYDTVAGWMESLDKVNGLGGTALSSAAKSTSGGTASVTYGLTSVLTDKALSHRYDEKKEGS